MLINQDLALNYNNNLKHYTHRYYLLCFMLAYLILVLFYLPFIPQH